MRKNQNILLVIIFFMSSLLLAQRVSISGTVSGDQGNPLIRANVYIQGTLIGTATDSEGNFKLTNIKKGEYRIEVTMVGYAKYISDPIDLAEEIKNFEVVLEETGFQYDQVVVTASKHEQNLRELPVSAIVIDSELFSRKNFNKLDDALRYASGVSITLDQVSIRGSSGYSRGAGTRVLVALDGIPLYTGDSGEIVWELVPTNEIGRVEIIKGSASSLYGSTAIGGVINIISKEITSNPVTYVRTYLGAYDKPAHNEWNWADEYRAFNGVTLSHSQSFGRLGVSASVSRTEDLSYRQNDWQKRYTGYLKTNYNFSESTSLTFLATGFVRDRGTFNFWKDSRNALVPPDDDQGQRLPSERFIYGLLFNHKFNADFSVLVKPSFYRSFWKDESESANSSRSNLYRSEVQTNYRLDKNVFLISGAEGQYGNVKSSLFGNHSSKGIGIYSQIEYEFNFPLTLSLGARFDYSQVGELDGESSVSPKLGFNYVIEKNFILRAAASKGFRAPTIGEAFTSTTTSGITVKPNPNIKSETNYSFEIGISKGFLNLFNIDAAIFHSEYYDLIEPGFDPADRQIFFSNVTRARVQGLELNTLFNLTELNIKLNFGYSYLWTRDITEDKALRYRPRHAVVASVDYSPAIYEFGIDFRYSSKVEEIDFEFVDLGLVIDGDKRVDIMVFDLRGGVNLFSLGFPGRVFINANNIFNYNYVEMIGNISPIRNISLNLELLF